MRARVKMSMLADPEIVVVHLTENFQGHDVWLRDPLRARQHGESSIGTVFKAAYTYSPPAAGFGGRIARLHRRVPCWKNNHSTTRSHGWPTRQEALRDLIKRHREETVPSSSEQGV